MKKFKLNISEDLKSLKTHGKDFNNPYLKQASIDLSSEELVIGGNMHSKTHSLTHSKTPVVVTKVTD